MLRNHSAIRNAWVIVFTLLACNASGEELRESVCMKAQECVDRAAPIFQDKHLSDAEKQAKLRPLTEECIEYFSTIHQQWVSRHGSGRSEYTEIFNKYRSMALEALQGRRGQRIDYDQERVLFVATLKKLCPKIRIPDSMALREGSPRLDTAAKLSLCEALEIHMDRLMSLYQDSAVLDQEQSASNLEREFIPKAQQLPTEIRKAVVDFEVKAAWYGKVKIKAEELKKHGVTSPWNPEQEFAKVIEAKSKVLSECAGWQGK